VSASSVSTPGVANTQPLAGMRIVLTRPRAQAGDFESRIVALGGRAVIAPAIAIVPPDTWTVADAALRRVGTYDWIAFTSTNAVRALVERATLIGIPLDELRDRQLAAVGTTTAALVATALRQPDMVPSVHTAKALGHELVGVDNGRVLLPRGNLADDALPAALRERGAFVDEIVVYRTVPGDGLSRIVADMRASEIDALLVLSASAVRFVADALETAGLSRAKHGTLVACLGDPTAAAARDAGFTHVVVAGGSSQDALIEQVVRELSRPMGPEGE